jgi:hypothetical protein
LNVYSKETDRQRETDRRQIDRLTVKFYKRTEVVMGKCLLHKETDASKVDPEVRAFVGKNWVCYFFGCSLISILKKLTDKEKQIEER